MVIHSDVSPRTFDASNQQLVGGKTGNSGARRGDKEIPLDLSGPRARLYMPVDKVVAACGKGGSPTNMRSLGPRSGEVRRPKSKGFINPRRSGAECLHQRLQHRDSPSTINAQWDLFFSVLQRRQCIGPTGHHVSSQDFPLKRRSTNCPPVLWPTRV